MNYIFILISVIIITIITIYFTKQWSEGFYGGLSALFRGIPLVTGIKPQQIQEVVAPQIEVKTEQPPRKSQSTDQTNNIEQQLSTKKSEWEKQQEEATKKLQEQHEQQLKNLQSGNSAALEQQLSTKKSEWEKLQKDASDKLKQEHSKQLEDLQQQNLEHQAKATNLETQLTQKNTEISNLTDAKNSLEQTKATLEASIQTLQTELTDKSTNNATSAAQITELEKSVSDKTAEINRITAEIQAKNSQIQLKTQEMSTLQQQLNTKTQQISNLDSQLATKTQQITTIENEKKVLTQKQQDDNTIINKLLNKFETWKPVSKIPSGHTDTNIYIGQGKKNTKTVWISSASDHCPKKLTEKHFLDSQWTHMKPGQEALNNYKFDVTEGPDDLDTGLRPITVTRTGHNGTGWGSYNPNDQKVQHISYNGSENPGYFQLRFKCDNKLPITGTPLEKLEKNIKRTSKPQCKYIYVGAVIKNKIKKYIDMRDPHSGFKVFCPKKLTAKHFSNYQANGESKDHTNLDKWEFDVTQGTDANGKDFIEIERTGTFAGKGWGYFNSSDPKVNFKKWDRKYKGYNRDTHAHEYSPWEWTDSNNQNFNLQFNCCLDKKPE